VYLLSGSLAVGFAVLTWKTRRFRGEKFSGNELDILGRIFSKAKFWKWAKEIYLEIGLRYAARFQGKFNSKEVSVSFALANKWMQGDPDITSTKLGFHRIVIKETLEMYEPHLEPEVMSKLCEGLGDSEVARRERIKNATKFS
jgi:hypothetical protein